MAEEVVVDLGVDVVLVNLVVEAMVEDRMVEVARVVELLVDLLLDAEDEDLVEVIVPDEVDDKLVPDVVVIVVDDSDVEDDLIIVVIIVTVVVDGDSVIVTVPVSAGGSGSGPYPQTPARAWPPHISVASPEHGTLHWSSSSSMARPKSRSSPHMHLFPFSTPK